MKRRQFLTASTALGTGLGTGLGAAGLAACKRPDPSAAASSTTRFHWKMVTTWPAQFPIFGAAATRLAERIGAASGGRLQIEVYGAGELVPAFEVFDSVSRGVAEIGHASPAYWRGVAPAAQLFTGVPFGMTAGQLNAWLHFDDGWRLWRETYAPFGILPFPAGNTGVQMGGWYHRPIERLEDFRGLKVRMAGLGAEVLEAIGATPVIIPGAELFTALQTGAIDATEFSGPANDTAFGLHQVARYYHYPGWHEPCGMLECLVNQDAYEGLPEDLQVLVHEICLAENDRCQAEFTARNQRALQELLDLGRVEIIPFPPAVLDGLRHAALGVLETRAADDALFGRIWQSFRAFQDQGRPWQRISDQAFGAAATAS